MSVTRVAVLNIALRALGEPPAVGPDDASPWVQRCNLAFPDVVRLLLETHNWNFAQTTVQLTTATAPEPVGWRYGYAKPADCLRIIQLSDTGLFDDVGALYDDQAGRILTDRLNPYLRYISRAYLDDTGGWPQVFAQAVGARIAHEIAPVTTQGESVKERLERGARIALREAKAYDAQQRPTWPVPPGRYVRARAGRRWGDSNGPR